MGLVSRFFRSVNMRPISPVIRDFDRKLFLNHHGVIKEQINFPHDEDVAETSRQDLLIPQNSSSIVSLVLKCTSFSIPNHKKNHVENLHGKLVKTAEIMRSAIEIHSKIVGSRDFCFLDPEEKISILEGDLLLADAWKRLGEMKNCQVVECMATGVGDIIESLFSNSPESIDLHDEISCRDFWVEKNFQRHASLQANTCRSGIILNGQQEELQMAAYEFGKNFSLAQQALIEMKYFSGDNLGSEIHVEFSAPILFHHCRNASSLFGQQNLKYFGNREKNFDGEKFSQENWKGLGVNIARNMKNLLSERAMKSLEKFPKNAAKKTLENVVKDLIFQ